MTEPVVDAAALDALEGDLGGTDGLAEVLGAFLAQTPTLLDGLHRALAQGDAERASRLAHSLKSTAATFGARRVATLCAELERAARADPASALLLATRLDGEWARARPALEARLDA